MASSCGQPVRTMSMVTSSGTRSPASMYLLAPRARAAVPWLTLARKMSPVEIFGHADVRRDELRLGALARAGGPDEDEPH